MWENHIIIQILKLQTPEVHPQLTDCELVTYMAPTAPKITLLIVCIFHVQTINNIRNSTQPTFCFAKGTCPTNPGAHLLGKIERLRQDAWGYSPCANCVNVSEVVGIYDSRDFKIMEGLGRFPRGNIMIGYGLPG